LLGLNRLCGRRLAKDIGKIASIAGVKIRSARHAGDALQLRPRCRAHSEADGVNHQLRICCRQRFGRNARIGIAGFLAVADQDDDPLALFGAKVLRRQRQGIRDRRVAARPDFFHLGSDLGPVGAHAAEIDDPRRVLAIARLRARLMAVDAHGKPRAGVHLCDEIGNGRLGRINARLSVGKLRIHAPGRIEDKGNAFALLCPYGRWHGQDCDEQGHACRTDHGCLREDFTSRRALLAETRLTLRSRRNADISDLLAAILKVVSSSNRSAGSYAAAARIG
jgi:hypothetical protein